MAAFAFGSSQGSWKPASTSQNVVQQNQPIQLQLHVSCTNLRNMERARLHKSDPMCVFFIPQPNTIDNWMLVGHTEVITNDLNPKFVKGFDIDYIFSVIQPLCFEVYDVPHPHRKTDLASQNFIGKAEFRLNELVSACGKTVTKTLINPRHPDRNNGTITVTAEEKRADLKETIPYDPRQKYVDAEQKSVHLAFSGKNLAGHAILGKGDPFFVLSTRENAQSPWLPVYKSASIRSTHNPYWDSFNVPLLQLNNGDPNRPLFVEVYDHKISGKHEFVGALEATLANLIPGKEIPLINPAKKSKNYHNSGYLVVRDNRDAVERKRIPNPYYLYSPYTFLDFLAGGLQLHLIVAIDFTLSNGHHSSRDSLHYFDPSGKNLNEYEQAIMSVGKILMEYDRDKQVPVYGFGGHPKGSEVVSHCFALNRNPSDPRVNGLEGVIRVYHDSFNYFGLSGPTHFAEIINEAARLARLGFSPQNQHYQVLLIITDGEICDMDHTTRAIVEASDLPLAIIIVGVGSADFEKMDILESDGAPLSWNGREEIRDIVEFVPFERFRRNPQLLAERTLMKLPSDVTSCMALHNIAPGVPLPVSQPYSQGVPLQMPPSGGPLAQPSPTSAPQGWQGSYMAQQQPSPQGYPQMFQQPGFQGVPSMAQQQQQPGSYGIPPMAQQQLQQQLGSSGVSVMAQQVSSTASPAQSQQDPSSSMADPKLVELLTRLGYLNFLDKFTSAQLTYDALKEFSKEDMKELDLPTGPCIAIYNAIQHNG